MTIQNATARGQSEADTLADAKAMLAAASADAAVKDKLGKKFMQSLASDVDEAVALTAGKLTLKHEKLAESAQLHDATAQLVDVLKDIRDLAEGNVDAGTWKTLGHGVDLTAKEPARMAELAHGIAAFLHAHSAIAKTIHLDSQHAHDLSHLADTISAAIEQRGALQANLKSDTHARSLLFTLLRAASHQVRVKARIAHRHDAKKLAAFESPVAHHRVVHRPAAPAPTSP